MPVPVTAIKTSHAVSIRINGKTIGRIQTWNPSQTRGVVGAYELNAATSGEVVENVPGNIGGLNIRVDRFELYKEPMMEIWGGVRWEMLTDQTNPLSVNEKWRFPDGTTETKVFVGCWFTSTGYTLSATGDRIVNVNAAMMYQKVYTL